MKTHLHPVVLVTASSVAELVDRRASATAPPVCGPREPNLDSRFSKPNAWAATAILPWPAARPIPLRCGRCRRKKSMKRSPPGPMKTQGLQPSPTTSADAGGVHERPDLRQRRAGRREKHAEPLRSESADERSERRPGAGTAGARTSRIAAFRRRRAPGSRADQVPQPETEVGVRLSHRRLGVRAAGGRGGPRFRRHRHRLRVLAGCEDRLRLLVLSGQGQRARRAERRPGERPRGVEVRGVLRRRARQCLCGGRADRQGTVDPQSGRSFRRAHHGLAEVV